MAKLTAEERNTLEALTGKFYTKFGKLEAKQERSHEEALLNDLNYYGTLRHRYNIEDDLVEGLWSRTEEKLKAITQGSLHFGELWPESVPYNTIHLNLYLRMKREQIKELRNSQ